MKSTSPRILSTSKDPLLLQTREMVLTGAFPGATVVSANSVAAASEACSTSNFDLAIIGYSFSRAEKLQMYETIQGRCSDAAILELYITEQPIINNAISVDASRGPEALVAGARQGLEHRHNGQRPTQQETNF